MLGNCEKMILISSSSNQWPQNQQQQQQIVDHNQKGLNLMASSAVIMDKPAAATASASAPAAADQKLLQQKQQHPPESLRCPRCDSSNTKFCYYNNYSLSQPRHFCKACKRYWTKGGTLRNVPVGGGCRKNKRVVKRSNTNNSSSLPSPDSTSSSSTSCANPIPILYGNSSSDLNLPFSGYDNHHHNNLQPSLNALGLGFSNIDHNREYNLNGFSNGSFLTGYSSLFGNPSSSSLTSLLASSKFTNGGGLFKEIRSAPSPSPAQSLFENLAAPFDHHHHHHHDQEFHVMGLNGGNQVGIKEVKLEEEGMMKRLEWEIGSDHAQQKNQMDQIAAPSSDPNSLYNNWSSTNWHDPSNLGSSIPSLI